MLYTFLCACACELAQLASIANSLAATLIEARGSEVLAQVLGKDLLRASRDHLGSNHALTKYCGNALAIIAIRTGDLDTALKAYSLLTNWMPAVAATEDRPGYSSAESAPGGGHSDSVPRAWSEQVLPPKSLRDTVKVQRDGRNELQYWEILALVLKIKELYNEPERIYKAVYAIRKDSQDLLSEDTHRCANELEDVLINLFKSPEATKIKAGTASARVRAR